VASTKLSQLGAESESLELLQANDKTTNNAILENNLIVLISFKGFRLIINKIRIPLLLLLPLLGFPIPLRFFGINFSPLKE